MVLTGGAVVPLCGESSTLPPPTRDVAIRPVIESKNKSKRTLSIDELNPRRISDYSVKKLSEKVYNICF